MVIFTFHSLCHEKSGFFTKDVASKTPLYSEWSGCFPDGLDKNSSPAGRQYSNTKSQGNRAVSRSRSWKLDSKSENLLKLPELLWSSLFPYECYQHERDESYSVVRNLRNWVWPDAEEIIMGSARRVGKYFWEWRNCTLQSIDIDLVKNNVSKWLHIIIVLEKGNVCFSRLPTHQRQGNFAAWGCLVKKCEQSVSLHTFWYLQAYLRTIWYPCSNSQC